jgi:two-component system chemotaxis response regulator CheB
MIRVLIVDNSKVIQEFLRHLLTSDPEIEIAGMADSGLAAIGLTRSKKPDIITMGIHLNGMDGYETSRAIMETMPTPIIIVTGRKAEHERKNSYLDAGALAVLLHPDPFDLSEYTSFRKELIQIVKLMSEIRVVKLSSRKRKTHENKTREGNPQFDDYNRIKVIAIGASTGGPFALKLILSNLPPDLSVPILIVQHIAPGFVKVFQKMLSSTSQIKLKIAEEGEILMPGIGYIAPDNLHMGVGHGNKIVLSNEPAENGSKPSVSYLFRSVAENYGPNALGVLLTGMGKDGADELKDMKDKGALTVVQNEESSVVFGMPGEALRIGAANQALSPERIAEILAKSGQKK